MKEKFLSKWAGALLLAAAFFALAALLAFGSQGRQSDWGWGFAILGLVSLAGWLLGRQSQLKLTSDRYARQRVMLGLNAVLSVFLFLVLLVGVNYIAARRHVVFDLTKNQINSLAQQTVNALDALEKPVRMVYVWAPSEFAPQIDAMDESVLEAYDDASDKVKVEFLNAAQDPLKFQAMGLNSFSGQPILVIEELSEKTAKKASEDTAENVPPSGRQEIGMIDEQNITSAILKLNDPTPRVLYLLTGHGELTLSGTGKVSMSSARALLEGQNYTFETLSLTGAEAKVPDDAAALLVFGPQVDLSEEEEKKLQDYLKNKGRLALFFQLPRAPLPRWKNLAKTLQVEVGRGIVLELDPQKSGGNPQIIAGLVEDSDQHPVLRSVNGAVLFPGVLPLRALPPSASSAETAVTALFETSINSNSLSNTDGEVEQTGDGPFATAVAVENVNHKSRALVIGNASFAADGAFSQFGNGSFFLGAVNWVVGNDALVTIPPKEPVTNSITLTDSTRNFISLFSLVALPLGVLLLGTAIWWKRR